MKNKICDLTKDYALYEEKNKKYGNRLIVVYNEKEIYLEYPIQETEDKFITFTKILHKFEKLLRTENANRPGIYTELLFAYVDCANAYVEKEKRKRK